VTILTLGQHITDAERALVAGLDTPRKIQDFLETTSYEPEYTNRTPLRVLRERRCHCFDGAIFAAAMLRRLGDPPILIDLFAEPLMDDEHLLAIFRRNGAYGCVAKSNFNGLGFREPVFRSLRELAMSYFEDYFNLLGQKSLRSYSLPIRLDQFDRLSWEVNAAGIDAIEKRTETVHRIPLLTPEMIRDLTLADARALAAGLHNADPTGLYQPGTVI
jgi:hypothetical protein